SGVVQAGAVGKTEGVVQAGLLHKGCDTCGAGGFGGLGGLGGPGAGMVADAGPIIPGAPPVPHMGPPGAVAAVGAITPGMPMGPINQRTSVRFVEPPGMQVSWLSGSGAEHILETPARYNFPQGGIYRLKLSGIPTLPPGTELYPTLEVLPATVKSVAYLAHSSVPVAFTQEDFEQVAQGNFLVKVIYLPDPFYQDLAAIPGPAELISSRLPLGVDPIIEAQRRGTILLIVRMGNIDLQAPNTPPMTAPAAHGGAMAPHVVPGPAAPPAAVPPAPAVPPAGTAPKATGPNTTSGMPRKGLLGWLTGGSDRSGKVVPASMSRPRQPGTASAGE
ncbi:MAG TPA: hypothetical protein VIL46_18985, partial [Gemmataceae bacterium]